jgi:hypothetical protein
MHQRSPPCPCEVWLGRSPIPTLRRISASPLIRDCYYIAKADHIEHPEFGDLTVAFLVAEPAVRKNGGRYIFRQKLLRR